MVPVRLAALAISLAALPLGVAAQDQPRVDFAREVQPILRDHCYACHGPEQQMNGLRLDRRADAMRGSGQSVIGPGNADGSKLYHRLTGTSMGTRMPPTGPLSTAQIAVLKAWIDQGAEWPDELAGAPPSPPVDSEAERLTVSIRDGNRAGVEDVLRTSPRAARARASGGSTPLMYAALYGDAALMKRLMDLGAEPGAANVAGATALMWSVPHIDRMRVLIASDVNVDARSEDRRSALVMAAGMTGSEPGVSLLLEYGASPFVARTGEPSALREAARANNPEVFQLLLDYGADGSSVAPDLLRTNCYQCAVAVGAGGAGPLALVAPDDTGLKPSLPPAASRMRPVNLEAVTPAAVHAAVERSLPLLQRIGQPFIQKTGCVSCHHNSLVASTVAVARRSGYNVDEQAASRERATIAAYLESWRERALQNVPIAGAQDTMSYLLFGLAASGHPADKATDAQARWLLRRQSGDGRWPLATLRPPIESNDVEVTAISMRAVQLYAPAADRADATRAIARAGDWLAAANGPTTEERAFRLLGLFWSKAPVDLVQGASRELVAGQRSDGGWSQEPSMESDAYATGQALVALRESNAVPADDRVVQRGVAFLLRTQLDDGSWFVKSRAMPIQAYFESGFPHGADQWISAAATAWAVNALAGSGL